MFKNQAMLILVTVFLMMLVSHVCHSRRVGSGSRKDYSDSAWINQDDDDLRDRAWVNNENRRRNSILTNKNDAFLDHYEDYMKKRQNPVKYGR